VAEIALAADAAWKARQHVSRAMLCLLSFSGLTFVRLPSTLRPPANKKQADWAALVKPDQQISKAIGSYMRRVRQENHGIKEENILSLLLPIGFPADDLDELLLAELNDFGIKRGTAAHVSVARHVTAGVNPIDESSQVARITKGLKDVDARLDSLLAGAR
jgi:hypothetical protein